MLWVPVLIWLVVRFGVPQIAVWVPELENYFPALLAFFSLLISVFPGFIVSFLLLDEKDNQLFPAIKVTPVSLSGFLLTRIAFMVVLGFFFSSTFLMFNGILSIPWLEILLLSLLSALNVPILILLISALAKNKVEGMTLLKVANVVIFIPAALFFVSNSWIYVLGIFPAFWVYKIASLPVGSHYFMVAGIGLLWTLFLNYLSYRNSVKKFCLL
jgi:fluoroquinolone transport system permease protein